MTEHLEEPKRGQWPIDWLAIAEYQKKVGYLPLRSKTWRIGRLQVEVGWYAGRRR